MSPALGRTWVAVGLTLCLVGFVMEPTSGEGWRRWYHLPPRLAPRIVGEPSGGNDPPGGLILELHIDQRPTTMRAAVARFRRLTQLMASSSQPLAGAPEADLQLLLRTLGEAAVDDLLRNATVSLDLPAERPAD